MDLSSSVAPVVPTASSLSLSALSSPSQPLGSNQISVPVWRHPIIVPPGWTSTPVFRNLIRRLCLDHFLSWREHRGNRPLNETVADQLEQYKRYQHKWTAIKHLLATQWIVTININQLRNNYKLLHEDLRRSLMEPQQFTPPSRPQLLAQLQMDYSQLAYAHSDPSTQAAGSSSQSGNVSASIPGTPPPTLQSSQQASSSTVFDVFPMLNQPLAEVGDLKGIADGVNDIRRLLNDAVHQLRIINSTLSQFDSGRLRQWIELLNLNYPENIHLPTRTSQTNTAAADESSDSEEALSASDAQQRRARPRNK